MERTVDFDKKDYPLPALAVELWQGFIFVNFDRNASPLAPTLERYGPFVEHYDLENCVCPGTFTLPDLPWNWKVMFENFNDGYHANRLHHIIQDFCPSDLAAFPVPWDDASNVIFRTNGYTHIDGGFNATRKALLPIFPELTEEERWRSTFALIPPSLCFGTAPDQAFFFIVRPTSANTIDVEIGYLLHPSALDHEMFDHLFKMSDDGRAGVRASRSRRDHQGAARHALALRGPRPLLVARREPRAVQSVAGAALPQALAGRGDHGRERSLRVSLCRSRRSPRLPTSWPCAGSTAG